MGNLTDEELHLLPAEKDEGASDDGSEDAGEDEEEDDEPVLCFTIHPLFIRIESVSTEISIPYPIPSQSLPLIAFEHLSLYMVI